MHCYVILMIYTGFSQIFKGVDVKLYFTIKL